MVLGLRQRNLCNLWPIVFADAKKYFGGNFTLQTKKGIHKLEDKLATKRKSNFILLFNIKSRGKMLEKCCRACDEKFLLAFRRNFSGVQNKPDYVAALSRAFMLHSRAKMLVDNKVPFLEPFLGII